MLKWTTLLIPAIARRSLLTNYKVIYDINVILGHWEKHDWFWLSLPYQFCEKYKFVIDGFSLAWVIMQTFNLHLEEWSMNNNMVSKIWNGMSSTTTTNNNNDNDNK